MWAVHQSPWDQRSCHSICRVRSHAIHHGVGTTWLPFLGQGNKHIMVYRHDPCLSLVLQYNHALPLALQRVYARHAHEPSIFLPPLRVFHDIHVSGGPYHQLYPCMTCFPLLMQRKHHPFAASGPMPSTLPDRTTCLPFLRQGNPYDGLLGGVSVFPFIATSMT